MNERFAFTTRAGRIFILCASAVILTLATAEAVDVRALLILRLQPGNRNSQTYPACRI